MSDVKELRRQAKEKGLKGYSKMGKFDLQLLLAGKRVPKKLRRSQVSVGTQTDFPVCNDCGLKAYVTHLSFKADAQRRKSLTAPTMAYVDDLEIDVDTGEVVGSAVDYSRL